MMREPSGVLLVEQKSEKGILNMFCKHCGSKIDPNNPVCPNCGTQVSLSGGNGFWDMAGEPKRETTRQQSPPIAKEKIVVKEVRKTPILPIAISAAFCLLFLVIMIAGRISARKTERELASGYESQLSQQQSDYEAQIEQLESRIRLLEEELNRPAEPQLPVRVLRSPTPETKPEGYSSPTGAWLFGFFIEGPATEFRWEKQQSDGTWIALDFDYRDIDSRYGLKIEQDLNSGTSKLVAVGLTIESAGNYKCTAITDHGSASDEVRLTIEATSTPVPTPTSTPASTATPMPSSSPDTNPDKGSSEGNINNTETPTPTDDGSGTGWTPWGGFHG